MTSSLPGFAGYETFRIWRADPAQWLPIALDIARSHSLACAAPHVFSTGTNVVVALDEKLILKIFPPFLRSQFVSERGSLAQLRGQLRIAIPEIVVEGERDGWPYLVITRLPGVLGVEAWPSLPEEQKERVLAEIGETIAEVQRAPVGVLARIEPDWGAFMRGQIEGCRARHERLGLPQKFLGGLDELLRDAAALIPLDKPPVILTGEYIPENFLLGRDRLHFTGLNGAMQFTNNDLAISDLRGRFENSDFQLNGFFKNIVTFLIFEDQPIGIEADLKSNFLDVDQLFAIGFGTGEQGPYKFSISHNLNMNFTYDVQSMKYKRFHPTSIMGDLLVKGQMAVARSVRFQAMGGAIDLSGIVDAKNPKAIDLMCSAKFNGVHIDSMFYVFNNFQQDFIGHQHLKGQAYADISLEATLDETLHIFPETFIADASTTIKNGELNNFPPMEKLNKYLDDEGLHRLRFADLKNDIHIENKTVYIPPMEIRSNLTTIQLSGTHTFDQKIDYRIVTPLRNKKKIDPDAAFGSIEQDNKGNSKLFLKITGTTDQYDVSYDKEAVKKKISSDIKREIQELKEAFKLKGKKKKKELELEKDDYFDWEPHP